MAVPPLSFAVERLLEQGVKLPDPAQVWVAPEVDPGRIAPGVVVHPGCRLRGASTSIGPGCVLGEDGPLTLEDSQLGDAVRLRGGYVAGSVFLDGAGAGADAHVRPGTILEEEASVAHAVGLKQTILLPFVTVGSLVNFCDVLMAGGTGRRRHSEVGSSYVHFNFTPHHDKATASLVGDVPRGVMLDQAPIFLGGQGGLVGPARLEYGTVIPAGVVWRGDQPEPGQLCRPPPPPEHGAPFDPEVFGSLGRRIRNNFIYLGNLHALRAWYEQVRRPFLGGTAHGTACGEGALRQVQSGVDERIKRLGEVAAMLPESARRLRKAGGARNLQRAAEQEALVAAWPEVGGRLRHAPESAGAHVRDTFLALFEAARRDHYVETLRTLTPEDRALGTSWLQAVVDAVAAGCPI